MFGSDFDMELVSEEDKDETMKILQEKSFRGLFLRLQFWINQICKSLYGKQKGIKLQLPHVQQVVMKSIVCFLSFMRDVVHELKSKHINSAESFDW